MITGATWKRTEERFRVVQQLCLTLNKGRKGVSLEEIGEGGRCVEIVAQRRQWVLEASKRFSQPPAWARAASACLREE